MSVLFLKSNTQLSSSDKTALLTLADALSSRFAQVYILRNFLSGPGVAGPASKPTVASVESGYANTYPGPRFDGIVLKPVPVVGSEFVGLPASTQSGILDVGVMIGGRLASLVPISALTRIVVRSVGL